jgi:hypothetical protein
MGARHIKQLAIDCTAPNDTNIRGKSGIKRMDWTTMAHGITALAW